MPCPYFARSKSTELVRIHESDDLSYAILTELQRTCTRALRYGVPKSFGYPRTLRFCRPAFLMPVDGKGPIGWTLGVTGWPLMPDSAELLPGRKDEHVTVSESTMTTRCLQEASLAASSSERDSYPRKECSWIPAVSAWREQVELRRGGI